MKPKIKQKRIDPRYFLHETMDRNKLEEIEPNPSPGPQKNVKLEIQPLPSPKRDDDEKENEKDLDPKTPGKQELLKGEKSLYEKIRIAIEEAYDEYLKEDEQLEEVAPAVNASSVAASRRAKGMKQAASGEWYTDKPGHAVPVNPNESDPGGARHIERGLEKQHQRPSDSPFRQIKRGGGN